MPDIVFDTNILADFLAQFFGVAQRGHNSFTERDTITRKLAHKVNQIVRWHNWDWDVSNTEARYPGKIAASTYAFVEIARKWHDIVQGRFTVEQMAGFIEQPPEWFIIESVDENLVAAFCDVPSSVLMRNQRLCSLEWADAIHIATAFGRGGDSLLATTDGEMRQVSTLEDRLI